MIKQAAEKGNHRMEITSFYFLCFYAAVLLLYYVLPGRGQKFVLIAASAFFYLRSGSPVLILYPLAAVACTYVCTRVIAGAERASVRRAALAADLVILLGILAAMKYVRWGRRIEVPLGLSFYTFTLVGYAVDVYNGLSRAGRDPSDVALYGMYFPLMVSGPILRFREDAAQLFSPHRLSYERVTRGLQRMVWGFFKKLVIAERCGVIAGTVFGAYEEYAGPVIAAGILAFTIQLYTDFSGCMDIVLGISETFGMTLPENFRTPFFSKTIPEYWRRWHITLGVWMKEYVFYPLLRTRLFARIGAALRARLGKKRGKNATTYAAMFVLWLTVGLWHGGQLKYVIGSGLLHWAYIVLGAVTLPMWTRLFGRLHIPMKGRFADAVRILRTFVLVNIGNTFFRAKSAAAAVVMLRRILMPHGLAALTDGTMTALGLDGVELCVLGVSVGILFAVSLLQEKGSVRDRIAGRPLPLRWLIWMGLLFYVILLGNYGPGYSAAEFIYQGF